jgi:hypothetical protein
VTESSFKRKAANLGSPFISCVDEGNGLTFTYIVVIYRGIRVARTFSNVSRPVCTMLSAISTAGILPEYVALVYPYVTLQIYFRPNCLALSTFISDWNGGCMKRSGPSYVISITLLSFVIFMACFTITLVSSNSVNILFSKPWRTSGFTYITPLGAT